MAKFLILIIVCLVFFAPTTMAEQADFEIANGKIAFVSDEDGDYEIYVIDPNGGKPQQLTFNDANEYDPDWSSDGTQIAFTSYRNEKLEIFVMDADGGNQQSLTSDLWAADSPAWSPDGSKIVFSAASRSIVSDIYVMNADGSEKVNLTNAASINVFPIWAPDNTYIFFLSDREYGVRPASDPAAVDIYRMNIDGSNPIRLFPASIIVDSIDISPDGRKIVTNVNLFESSIVIVDVDNLDQVIVTDGIATNASYPTWSADGSKIAFVHNWSNLAVMNKDGTNSQVIWEGNSGIDYRDLDWQPTFAPISPTSILTTPSNP